MLSSLLFDFRYALRRLRASRAFALGSASVIAVGVAAAGIVSSVVDGLLLRPLPVQEPERLVRIWKHDLERGFEHFPLTYPEYSAWAEASRGFNGLAAIWAQRPWDAVLDPQGEPVDLLLGTVSTNFFEVLGTGAALGRVFVAEDARATTLPPVILSHAFWQRAFGGAPDIVGRSIPLSRDRHHVFEVLGVMPADFTLSSGADAWTPLLAMRPAWEDGPGCECDLIGRLAEGWSLEAAREELAVVHANLVRDQPDQYRPMEVVATPLLETIVGRTGNVALYFLAAVALLLLLAVANLAALFLSRMGSRAHETTVLLALGASPARLVRRFLAEAILIAVAGWAAGLFLTGLGIDLLLAFKGGELPLAERIGFNGRVVASSALVVAVSCIGFGVLPALRLLEARGANVSRVRSPGLEQRHASPLIVAQFALTLVLLVGAGLLVRTLIAQQSIDRGVSSHHLLSAKLRVPISRFSTPESRVALYRQVLVALDAHPDLRSPATMLRGPGAGEGGYLAPFRFEGQLPEEAKDNPYSTFESVSESFFSTMGIPILQGRAFERTDRLDSRRVAIVSRAVAERYWPGEDPLGKHVILGEVNSVVVGVSGNTRYNELTRDWQSVYFPMEQNPLSKERELHPVLVPNRIVLRTGLEPEQAYGLIANVIREVDASLSLREVRAMDDLLAVELGAPRFNAWVATLFGSFALLISALGLYASLRTFVLERRAEVGLRMSLGATPARIRAWVLLRAFKLAGAGIALGLLIALAVSQLVSRFLFEVTARDPLTFAAVAGGVAVVATVAAYLPAQRASRVDPLRLLREE